MPRRFGIDLVDDGARGAVEIVDRLEDPVTNLVRRDSLWEKLGLRDEDVQTADQVIDVILKHKMIMQRPVVVTDKKAIIGRPKERVRELLGG